MHDVAQQHLRALKSMGQEPSGAFITSMLELKLDTGTLFEWQKHSQGEADVPHYKDILNFINLRAQAAEPSISVESFRKASGSGGNPTTGKAVNAFMAGAGPDTCVLCKGSKHPLYSCTKFKALPQDQRVTTVKSNHLCMNCLKSGHFVKHCRSLHRCRDCQKPHHSLLHVDPKANSGEASPNSDVAEVQSHTVSTLTTSSLLMTCQVGIIAPNGLSTKARALLDSGSSASFVSDRLARSLNLPRSRRSTRIFGIAGLRHGSSSHFVTNFCVTPLNNSKKSFDVSAIIIPQVTHNLPARSVSGNTWSHLEGLQLADPNFGRPCAIDILFGVDVFVETLLHGRRVGPPGCPMAIETEFGWVLAGAAGNPQPTDLLSCHASLQSGDDLLRKFWEVEEPPPKGPGTNPFHRRERSHGTLPGQSSPQT